ncbi:MAG: class I SAM-dependent methyltransferase [Candidatus Methanoperedens sp.]
MLNSGKKNESLFWDKEYESNMRIWGERPSELAIIAVKYLQNHRLNDKFLSILDIGCGYGRDCLYLAKNLNCCVLGIDTSQKALEILAKSLVGPFTKAIQFRCCNFMDINQSKYDIVFASNLYQVLQRKQREELRKKITSLLKPQGLLFLNNLSVNDPEEYGKGEPCPDEPNSFKGDKYLHFCTRKELEEDFRFLTIQELYEHKYDEPRAQGDTHHHISWILIGELGG